MVLSKQERLARLNRLIKVYRLRGYKIGWARRFTS